MSPETSKSIQIDYIVSDIRVSNAKDAYQKLSNDIAGDLGVSSNMLYQNLLKREETDHASIGDGVAIPHLKLKGAKRPFTALMKLKTPIEFEKNMDSKPVDIICLLISPQNDGPLHLRRLSRLSRLFRNHDLCEQIRDTDDIDAIRSMIISPEGWLLAA